MKQIKSAQDRQDEIFRKMSVAQKIKSASDFYRFMKTLNRLGANYGTRRVIKKNRMDSR